MEDGLVEKASAMRGRKVGEPRPNWNPLVLDASALKAYSAKVVTDYQSKVRVQHHMTDSAPNGVGELHQSDGSIEDELEVLNVRVDAVLTAFREELQTLEDNDAILVVTHGAVADRLSEKMYGRSYGSALTGSFALFGLQDDGISWKSVFDEWRHAQYVGQTSAADSGLVCASISEPLTTSKIAKLTVEELDVAPDVKEFTVSNGSLTMRVLNYGCTILSILAPDRYGEAEEITLCYRSYDDLIKPEHLGPYYGAVVGRVANRIGGGSFTLNGKLYNLALNNKSCSLHGGNIGFDKKLFKATAQVIDGEKVSLTFKYRSANGEEGYPGTLDIEVTYALTIYNTIEMTYCASFADITEGLSTPINLTNHSYFNLSGSLKRDVLDHKLMLPCSRYTPYDDDCIPTGEMASVYGSNFDFTKPVVLGERILNVIAGGGKVGLDHNWVVDGAADMDTLAVQKHNINFVMPNTPALRHAATLTDEVSGRQMKIHTSQPGIQVYTNNWASEDKASSPHIVHNAIALETQHFPDSVNKPSFPKGSVIAPGEQYQQKSIFSFSVIQ